MTIFAKKTWIITGSTSSSVYHKITHVGKIQSSFCTESFISILSNSKAPMQKANNPLNINADNIRSMLITILLLDLKPHQKWISFCFP